MKEQDKDNKGNIGDKINWILFFQNIWTQFIYQFNLITIKNWFKSINLEFKIFFYESVTLAIPIHFDILPRSLNIFKNSMLELHRT